MHHKEPGISELKEASALRPPPDGASGSFSASARAVADSDSPHVSRPSHAVSDTEKGGVEPSIQRPGPRALPSNCAQILLVEDNPGDARLTREVFAEGRITNHLHVASDGVEAIRFLRREGPYRDKPRPDLILLDLNLPKKDGREVLAEIKADAALQSIPVVVLTTSAADQDVDNTYRLHANSFITKPVDLDQFIAVVRSIETFWLTIVRLPH